MVETWNGATEVLHTPEERGKGVQATASGMMAKEPQELDPGRKGLHGQISLGNISYHIFPLDLQANSKH